MTIPQDPPNPGSDAALDLGCICPIMDNNHGKFLPWQGGYIVVQGCPVHDATAHAAESPSAPEPLLSYPDGPAPKRPR
jgi:hypothetical protein